MVKKHILFVCMANVNRSKTFAEWFEKNKPDEYEARSSGIYSYSQPGYKLDQELLDWADKVYVMDIEQYIFIFNKFHEYIDKVKILGISDQYDYDSEYLKDLIEWMFYKQRFFIVQ